MAEEDRPAWDQPRAAGMMGGARSPRVTCADPCRDVRQTPPAEERTHLRICSGRILASAGGGLCQLPLLYLARFSPIPRDAYLKQNTSVSQQLVNSHSDK